MGRELRWQWRLLLLLLDSGADDTAIDNRNDLCPRLKPTQVRLPRGVATPTGRPDNLRERRRCHLLCNGLLGLLDLLRQRTVAS